MLKRWLVAAFSLALLFAVCPNKCSAQQKQKGQSVPESSPAIVDNSIRQYDQNRPGKESPEPHAGIEWSNWAVVLVGCITAWAVFRQVQESAEATEAMRDSIRLQGDAMRVTVNTQRPYIVIEVDTVASNDYVFRAKNVGKTPAKILSVWFRPLPPVGHKERLTVPPDSETRDTLISHPPQLLPQKADFPITKVDATNRLATSGPHAQLFYMYGRIRYLNTLESGQRETYETKFLYWIPPVQDFAPSQAFEYTEYNTWT